MKPKLLLYLTAEANPAKNAVAATLAWAAEAAGWYFEVYYDSYRLGEHYGGGDPAWMPPGYLTGGTMTGGHHFERLYLLLHRFETLALTDGPVAFGQALEQLDVPRLAVSGVADLYLKAFEVLGQPLPKTAVVIDAQPRRDLAGIDAYLYPEIAGRRALGLEIGSLADNDLSRLMAVGVQSAQPLYLDKKGLSTLEGLIGLAVETAPGGGEAATKPAFAGSKALASDGTGESAKADFVAQPLGATLVASALDALAPADDFASITERLARRWLEQCAGGWILADPTAVAAWLPEAWRERRLSIYGKPQQGIIQRLEDALRQSKTAVLGRQYEDSDFFALSSLGLAFQLIDPGRPPFPVLRVAGYRWESDGVSAEGAVDTAAQRVAGKMPALRPPTPGRQDAGATTPPQPAGCRRYDTTPAGKMPALQVAGATGVSEMEPDDEQLRAWAREGRVLVSVIFWTGMIRELENLPRVIDLVALSRMKGGLALTTPALAYQPEALELLRVPIERGGVFPHLELLLASCGLGASIESRMPAGRLAAYLQASQQELERLGVPEAWRPQGWWATMDPEMLPLPAPKLPLMPKIQSHAPFLQVRYRTPGGNGTAASPVIDDEELSKQPGPAVPVSSPGMKRRLGDWAREHGLRALLAPYRPYELFAPGPLRKEIIEAVREAGLRYMFSKAGFGQPPAVLYQDADFIALNYTAGQWDGWTPFETINSVDDLRCAERRLLALKKPGWLVGTLDTCLWAFTGPIWERGTGLRDIAHFVAQGGDSKRLINVTPQVVARYARLLGE